MRLILFFLIFLMCQTIKAQLLSKFNFFGGYGFYEGINLGSEYFFDSKKQSISLSMGFDNFTKKNQENMSVLFSYNLSIFRNYKVDPDKFKWHLNSKAVLWQLEDEYYLWRVVSIIPSINRIFYIYKNLKLSLDAGPSFNIVLYNKRKTYKEVGWPYHVMPDYRLLLIF
jgi:hypothetical protein